MIGNTQSDSFNGYTTLVISKNMDDDFGSVLRARPDLKRSGNGIFKIT